MKYALLLSLLVLTSCTSTSLSELEVAKATSVAGPGYGSHVLGRPLTDTVGLRIVFDAGYTKTYEGQADSLAYGLVPLGGRVSYTVQYGQLTAVYFKALGFRNGNKLQGCMERLYGPLLKHSPTSFEGRRGIVQAQVDRGVFGSCSVVLIQGPDSSLAPLSTKRFGTT